MHSDKQVKIPLYTVQYMKLGKSSPVSKRIFEPLYIGENLHPFLSEHLKGQCHQI